MSDEGRNIKMRSAQKMSVKEAESRGVAERR